MANIYDAIHVPTLVCKKKHTDRLCAGQSVYLYRGISEIFCEPAREIVHGIVDPFGKHFYEGSEEVVIWVKEEFVSRLRHDWTLDLSVDMNKPENKIRRECKREG